MAARLYEHLIKPLSVGKIKREETKEQSRQGTFNNGPGNAAQKVWLTGRDHLEGINLNFTWGLHKGVGEWHTGRDLHTHPYSECHMFDGLDPANINYLGAEIEIDLGKEHERYIIDKPSVVICPAGVPHAPIVTRWVNTPYAFFSINLAAESVMKFID